MSSQCRSSAEHSEQEQHIPKRSQAEWEAASRTTHRLCWSLCGISAGVKNFFRWIQMSCYSWYQPVTWWNQSRWMNRHQTKGSTWHCSCASALKSSILFTFVCFSCWSIVTAGWVFSLKTSQELWTWCFHNHSSCRLAFGLSVNAEAVTPWLRNQENSGVRRQHPILGRHGEWDMVTLRSTSRLSAKQEESAITF